MRMVERKQDTLNTRSLIRLMENGMKKEDSPLHVNLRRRPQIKGDKTLSHLANRIVEEVTVSSSPRQLATQVLNQAGIETKTVAPKTNSTHLEHVSRRAREIPQSSQPKIRRVKRSPVRQTPPSLRRGPPVATRNRPAVGAEHEGASLPRQARPIKKNQSRRGLFRR